MAKEEKILIVLTGGTIDSKFEPTRDTIVPSEQSIIAPYLMKLKLYNEFLFEKVCMKDSRELTLEDRKKMIGAIRKSGCTKVIITHGTYTMVDTAQYMADNFKKSKTIVLTGSMIPLEGFSNSDASFNLGYAIASIQHLPKGIYICMNGKVFKPENVDKNRLEGRFEEKKK